MTNIDKRFHIQQSELKNIVSSESYVEQLGHPPLCDLYSNIILYRSRGEVCPGGSIIIDIYIHLY
jgi:hypothetical protein